MGTHSCLIYSVVDKEFVLLIIFSPQGDTTNVNLWLAEFGGFCACSKSSAEEFTQVADAKHGKSAHFWAQQAQFFAKFLNSLFGARLEQMCTPPPKKK